MSKTIEEILVPKTSFARLTQKDEAERLALREGTKEYGQKKGEGE